MASPGVVKLAYVVWICMVVVIANAPHAEAATSCSSMSGSLQPCLEYVKGGSGGAEPPSACCDGVKSLITAGNTTSDRQANCKCVLEIIGKNKEINGSLAFGLPAQCGVNIPFPSGSSTDCNKVR